MTPINRAMHFLALQAPNPGPLTLEGTNTYVIERTVVDPGSDHERHLEAILAAGPIERIVLTHRHPDHVAGAGRLSELSGGSVLAAMLAAGLFEYNFGDSEFLMLFLVLITLPYAVDRAPTPTEARD